MPVELEDVALADGGGDDLDHVNVLLVREARARYAKSCRRATTAFARETEAIAGSSPDR